MVPRRRDAPTFPQKLKEGKRETAKNRLAGVRFSLSLSLLPALIGFPFLERVKPGPTTSGVSEGSPLVLCSKGEIVDRPGRRIGQRLIGVVDLHEIPAVRLHGVRVVHLR